MSLAELEDSLLRNLFRGYQKWVRPVQHANDTITVRFGLKISQLVDVVRPPFDHLGLVKPKPGRQLNKRMSVHLKIEDIKFQRRECELFLHIRRMTL